MNKEKSNNNIITTIVIILIIIGAIVWYPWFVEVNDYGETVCSNILGYRFNCR